MEKWCGCACAGEAAASVRVRVRQLEYELMLVSGMAAARLGEATAPCFRARACV